MECYVPANAEVDVDGYLPWDRDDGKSDVTNG